MYDLPYQPIHWLSRTPCFKPDEKESQPESFPERKTNLSPVMKTLKNSGDLGVRTKCSWVLQTCPDSRLYGLLYASIFCVSRSAALLDCNTSGRANGNQRLRSHSVRRQIRRGTRGRRLRNDQPTWHRIYQFRTRIPYPDVRWVHCSRFKNGHGPAHHPTRENHRYHRHNRTS